MSGSSTMPTRAAPAGAAYAAATSVPSVEVRVSVPRSATSPLLGGAGGRLSVSWHMPRFYRGGRPAARSGVGGGVGRSGGPAEDAGGALAAAVAQPVVLLVGLRDEPLEQPPVD